jgi:predicted amidohydrolase YtcJ
VAEQRGLAPAGRAFFNGTIHAMDRERRVVDELFIAEGRIVLVGGAAKGWRQRPGVEATDLRGRTVVPGFIDSHNHLLQTGLNAEHVDLSTAETVEDVLAAIEARATTTPAGGWVVTSSRWHETQLKEQRFPRRDELDRVAPQLPVLLRRGGHNVVANSVALRLAGIDESVSDPPGGTFVRDADDRLTGHVIGAPAFSPIIRLLPETTPAQMEAAINRATALYHAAGITGVIEPGLAPAEIRSYQALHAAGELSMRTTLMPRLSPGTTAESLDRALAELRALPLLTGFGDQWLRIGGIKLVADGGVETSYLREPFAHADDPSSPRGKPQISAENLAAVCREAARLRWQVGVHCVGDAAIDLVLDAFEEADRARGIAGLRWTLIHMTRARPEQLERARQLDLCIAAQQPLIYALGAGWLRYWGPERAAAASPLDAFAVSGLPVGGGSDSPVTPYQPLLGICSSVTRATQLAGVLGPEHAISAGEALAWYTRGSAYLANASAGRGSLEPGKLADLVILGADPLRAQPDAIKDIPVEETIVAGRTVWRA